MDRLLTMPEVAEVTRAPLETVRSWRAQGIGPQGFKVGRRVVYREADVSAWIEKQREAAVS